MIILTIPLPNGHQTPFSDIFPELVMRGNSYGVTFKASCGTQTIQGESDKSLTKEVFLVRNHFCVLEK